MSSSEVPQGNPTDNDYVSRPGHKQDPIPVLSDEAPIEEETADNVAVDKSNIIDDKNRHAAKSAETYREPGDNEGLPENDGRSAVAQ
ncbi:hypothetical protein BGAL_0076g00070 [Botrytis galanthina]|uniref:Histone chaperone domain-containing protein n=1 Tax=Botrytis galanthina TaxID=278940 RepID=A0A4S8R6M5_9HELO|nr:hypothetical protein BGAL_0076g00070 [Botrytis galanthina]